MIGEDFLFSFQVLVNTEKKYQTVKYLQESAASMSGTGCNKEIFGSVK